MELILKAVSILFCFVIMPILVGLLFTKHMKEERNSLGMSALCGYAAIFALFELTALPLIFLRISFSVLVYGFSGFILIAGVCSVFLNRKRAKELVRFQLSGIKTTPWTMYAAILLIALQVCGYVFFMLSDLDDAFYVATATTTVHTNGMFQYDAYTGDILKQLPSRYVLSPFPIFLAFVSECIHMHPAAVAHTIMPIFFVPLAYIVYGLIGRKLFSGDKKAVGLFLCFVSIVNIFSYYSVYTQGTFLLIRIWQGKAFLAGILLPALFYLCIRVMKESAKGIYWVVLLCILTACCMVSSMGIMLSPVMAGIFSLLYGVFHKDIKKTGKMILCCIPCVVCAGIYLVIR